MEELQARTNDDSKPDDGPDDMKSMLEGMIRTFGVDEYCRTKNVW